MYLVKNYLQIKGSKVAGFLAINPGVNGAQLNKNIGKKHYSTKKEIIFGESTLSNKDVKLFLTKNLNPW